MMELAKQHDENIDKIIERRLLLKKSFSSKLALWSRKEWNKTIYFLLLIGFFVFIAYYLSFGNEILIGIMILIYSIFLIPRGFSKELWHLEKARYMWEIAPKTIKTIVFTITMILRWIYPLGAIFLLILVSLGIIKTLTGFW